LKLLKKSPEISRILEVHGETGKIHHFDSMGKLTISTGPFSIAMSYVNYGKTMERSTMFNGKTHYFDWATFNSYVRNYHNGRWM